MPAPQPAAAMRSNSSSPTPTRRLSPTITAYDTPTTSSHFRRDIEALTLNNGDDSTTYTTEHRRSLSSSQNISYRLPTISNGERDSLLPSPPQSSITSPTSASTSRTTTPPRADRYRGVAIVLVTMLVLLILTLHQHLTQSSVEVRTVTLPSSSLHQSHAHEHASVTEPAAIDASATFDEGNDVSVLYHPIIIDALPYTTAPLDSTGTSIHLHGRYSDSSNFLYPLCTFSRVCATATQLHLTVQSNYSVWVYYSLLLPYCHDLLARRLELCGCFHYGWRVGLLEWRGLLTDKEKADGEALGRRMVESQFGGVADWTRGWEQVGPARDRPTVEELQQMQWVQQNSDDQHTPTLSWLDRARFSLSSLVSPSSTSASSSTPGLYPDPFSAPPFSTPPTNWTSPIQQPDAALLR